MLCVDEREEARFCCFDTPPMCVRMHVSQQIFRVCRTYVSALFQKITLLLRVQHARAIILLIGVLDRRSCDRILYYCLF